MSAFLIAACGLTFVILMGSFDFSVPSLLRLSALICAVFFETMGWWVIPIALISCLFCGFVNGLLVARLNVPSFMATLTVSVITEGITYMFSKGFVWIITDPMFKALSTTFILGLPSIFYWAISIWAISVVIALATPFGRKTYMIGGNLSGAILSGVNVKRQRIYVFVLSSLFSAIAGILYLSHWGGGTMAAGVAMTMPLFASVVIGGTSLTGGRGGPHRTLLGVIIATWVQAGMAMLAIDPNIQNIVFGIIAILVTIATIDRRRIKIIK
jgi:ribose transport system permease protein/putative xylitol transport system permease protein